MAASIIVHGVAELDSILASLPVGVVRALERKAFRVLGKRAVDKMRAEAAKHERTGTFRRSLTVRAVKRSRVRVGVRIVSDTRTAVKTSAISPKTGRMRRVLARDAKGDKIYKGRYYAGYIEFGTRRTPARKPMRLTLASMKPEARAEFTEAVRDALRAARSSGRLLFAGTV